VHAVKWASWKALVGQLKEKEKERVNCAEATTAPTTSPYGAVRGGVRHRKKAGKEKKRGKKNGRDPGSVGADAVSAENAQQLVGRQIREERKRGKAETRRRPHRRLLVMNNGSARTI